MIVIILELIMPAIIGLVGTLIGQLFSYLFKKLVVNYGKFLLFFGFWVAIYLTMLSKFNDWIESLLVSNNSFSAEFWKAGVSLLPERSPTYITILTSAYLVYWIAVFKDRMSKRLHESTNT
ncbi:hypothetical protein J3U31_06495 [Gilliamella sp. B3486]|uniref:hypothetical protein n=1 Tax=unclassified Gilliamella TaxID=2685620 RepID=UPI002269AAA6|nr:MULTISPECIES: hypothetical protein [unclassified Gilliamella]MCX8597582.1 hypothetical protein [Gilliamella sp. B3493]MCX8599256.1 hypothetical protein [Gilliamella sp. B3486]MCX8705245.1 hypothetical protein [Gilliamella sp. B3127]